MGKIGSSFKIGWGLVDYILTVPQNVCILTDLNFLAIVKLFLLLTKLYI